MVSTEEEVNEEDPLSGILATYCLQALLLLLFSHGIFSIVIEVKKGENPCNNKNYSITVSENPLKKSHFLQCDH